MRCTALLWAGISIALSQRVIAQTPALNPLASKLQSLMGVAGRGYGGSACLAIRSTPVRPGEPFVLVDVPVSGVPGSVEALTARVDSTTSADCSHDENPVASLLDDSVYTLTLLQGQLKPGGVYFAVRVPTTRIQTNGRTATLVIDRASRPITLRACTSNEGVHLTAWMGTPFTSKRLWHRYVHSESDFFASRCLRSEYRDPE